METAREAPLPAGTRASLQDWATSLSPTSHMTLPERCQGETVREAAPSDMQSPQILPNQWSSSCGPQQTLRFPKMTLNPHLVWRCFPPCIWGLRQLEEI